MTRTNPTQNQNFDCISASRRHFLSAHLVVPEDIPPYQKNHLMPCPVFLKKADCTAKHANHLRTTPKHKKSLHRAGMKWHHGESWLVTDLGAGEGGVGEEGMQGQMGRNTLTCFFLK